MKNLILFGAPGSGKGTQAARLTDRYGLQHISTGDLFRSEMGQDTPLGREAKDFISRGQLVPDSVTIGMLRNRVLANPEAKGFIFDGFPRNLPQCLALDNLLSSMGQGIHCLLLLEVPDEEIIARILSRAHSSGRADDGDPAIIRKRIEVYRSETLPVFDHYQQMGKAFRIVGVGTVDNIFQSLCSAIDDN